MAADIGRGYIEFRFTDKGTSKILWCLVSLSCHQTDCPRSVRTLQGGKEDNHGKKNNECKVTVDGATRYDFPYFVPIEDGDEVTIKHYKEHDVPVANIALPGRKKRYYAIFGAASKEEADLMNRTFNNWARKEERDRDAQIKLETSYEALLETGYDLEDDSDISELVAYKIVVDALHDALNELTDEKMRLVKMVVNKESQQSVADEIGISRRTLRGRKDDVMSELAKKLDNHR